MVAPSGLVAPNPNAGRAQDIADRVAQAVRAAADADWRYARILRSLKAQEGLGVSTATWSWGPCSGARPCGRIRGVTDPSPVPPTHEVGACSCPAYEEARFLSASTHMLPWRARAGG
ncbi:hypothetical protein SCALM49S_01569 [Streptomyces californicus]